MDAKTLCLAVLARGDASGYEIKKTLESPPYGHFQDTGFGSIYPALTKLTEVGLADCTEMAQDKRPDKKVYSITAKGRDQLLAALMEPPGPDRYRSDFLFVMFLAHLLPPEQAARLVDDRIASYEERIAHMTSGDCHLGPAGQRFVHGFGLAVYRAAAAYLKQNRNELLADIQGSARHVAE